MKCEYSLLSRGAADDRFHIYCRNMRCIRILRPHDHPDFPPSSQPAMYESLQRIERKPQPGGLRLDLDLGMQGL